MADEADVNVVFRAAKRRKIAKGRAPEATQLSHDPEEQLEGPESLQMPIARRPQKTSRRGLAFAKNGRREEADVEEAAEDMQLVKSAAASNAVATSAGRFMAPTGKNHVADDRHL